MGNEINEALGSLKPKDKDPHSASVLTRWIAEAENQIGGGRSGRLSWLVASVVVTAKLQEVVDDLGKPVFLLKGGSLLQHRLGLAARPTKDLDGLVREDIDAFICSLDEKMRGGWGADRLLPLQGLGNSGPREAFEPSPTRIDSLAEGQVLAQGDRRAIA